MATISTVDVFRGGFPIHVLIVLVTLGLIALWLRRRRRARRSSDGSGALPGTAKPLSTESPEVVSRVAGRSALAAAVKAAETSRPVRSDAGFTASSAGWAVETHGLTKRFGANVAVNDVELLVPRGSAFGYLGPNGAGPHPSRPVDPSAARCCGVSGPLPGDKLRRHRATALAGLGNERRPCPGPPRRDPTTKLARATSPTGGAGVRSPADPYEHRSEHGHHLWRLHNKRDRRV